MWRGLFIRRFHINGPANAKVVENLSNHQQFLQNKPSQKILDHLDNLGLGFVGKKKSRTAMKDKYQQDLPGLVPLDRRRSYIDQRIHNPKNTTPSSPPSVDCPFPFHKGPKNVQNSYLVNNWEETPNLNGVPEIAILGRSNVGKSTLVNALLGYTPSFVQKAVVSNKPGETRALQLFTIGKHYVTKDPILVITDMPGYGFALMKSTDQERCFTLCSKYLRLRGKSLKRLLLVLDARHGFKYTDMKYLRDMIAMNYSPEDDMNDVDSNPNSIPNTPEEVIHDHKEAREREITEPTTIEKELMKNLSWKLQVVLTKCDLVERSILARRVQEIRDDVMKSFPYLGKGGHSSLPVMMVSGLFGNGIVELQKELASLVPPKDSQSSSKKEKDMTNKQQSSSPASSPGLIGDITKAFTHLSPATSAARVSPSPSRAASPRLSSSSRATPSSPRSASPSPASPRPSQPSRPATRAESTRPASPRPTSRDTPSSPRPTAPRSASPSPVSPRPTSRDTPSPASPRSASPRSSQPSRSPRASSSAPPPRATSSPRPASPASPRASATPSPASPRPSRPSSPRSAASSPGSKNSKDKVSRKK